MVSENRIKRIYQGAFHPISIVAENPDIAVKALDMIKNGSIDDFCWVTKQFDDIDQGGRCSRAIFTKDRKIIGLGDYAFRNECVCLATIVHEAGHFYNFDNDIRDSEELVDSYVFDVINRVDKNIWNRYIGMAPPSLYSFLGFKRLNRILDD